MTKSKNTCVIAMSQYHIYIFITWVPWDPLTTVKCWKSMCDKWLMWKIKWVYGLQPVLTLRCLCCMTVCDDIKQLDYISLNQQVINSPAQHTEKVQYMILIRMICCEIIMILFGPCKLYMEIFSWTESTKMASH